MTVLSRLAGVVQRMYGWIYILYISYNYMEQGDCSGNTRLELSLHYALC